MVIILTTDGQHVAVTHEDALQLVKDIARHYNGYVQAAKDAEAYMYISPTHVQSFAKIATRADPTTIGSIDGSRYDILAIRW